MLKVRSPEEQLQEEHLDSCGPIDAHPFGSCTRDPERGCYCRCKTKLAELEANRKLGFFHLERRVDVDGIRDYLAGREVHCGTTLEILQLEQGEDRAIPRPAARPAVLVRYEAQLSASGSGEIELFAGVGGHSARIGFDDSMRFRWPKSGGA